MGNNFEDQTAFMASIASYHTDLARYCQMVASTPWEGDDLLQETLIKAYQSSTSLNDHPKYSTNWAPLSQSLGLCP